jgi:putative transposase
VHPTDEQASTLKQMFGLTRWVYNKCVDVFDTIKEYPQGCRLEFLRSTIKELESTTPWLAELGLADFRDGAVRDLDKAWIAHGAKIKKMKSLGATDLPACKFKYRSKRDPQQSFEMRGRDWGRSSGQYASVFHRDKLKSAEPLPSDEVMQQHSFRVVCDRLGHYFLCVPMPARTWSESQAPKSQHGVVALDPGVRTFQTCYDADGTVVEWGAGDMKQIFRNCLCADKLQSKWQQTKKASIKKAWLRQLVRIKDRISEVHKKMASWLCNNYRVILIPQFDTSRMVRRVGRKINSKTARGMCTWAHFAFRQRLLQAAEQRPWCSVIVCDEAYTSKTCGQCGAIHAKLGGRKTFKCPACGYCADRDASAARNILIRYLTRNNIVPTGSLLTE